MVDARTNDPIARADDEGGSWHDRRGIGGNTSVEQSVEGGQMYFVAVLRHETVGVTEPLVPRLRRAPLPDDAVIVVRGDDLDPAAARHQASLFRRRYPDWERWGLSAYYARSDDEVDDLAADQLERFPELLVYRVAVLLAAGIEVVPTFRTPHVTLAFTGDLDEGLARLERADHDRRANPYHVP